MAVGDDVDLDAFKGHVFLGKVAIKTSKNGKLSNEIGEMTVPEYDRYLKAKAAKAPAKGPGLSPRPVAAQPAQAPAPTQAPQPVQKVTSTQAARQPAAPTAASRPAPVSAPRPAIRPASPARPVTPAPAPTPVQEETLAPEEVPEGTEGVVDESAATDFPR